MTLLVASCAASPARPLLVEAAPLPADVRPLRPLRIYTCDCEPGLVCCEDACAMCVQPGALCPAVACRR